jgi:NADP-dependent alcohol dehydrogenase
LAQYRYVQFSGTDDECKRGNPKKTVEFFHTMGMDTNYLITQSYGKTMILLLIVLTKGWKGLGKANITLDKVKSIVEIGY